MQSKLLSHANSEPYDASDPEQEKRAKAAQELRLDRLRNVEQAILSTPHGREWLWQILSDCHVWEKRLSVTGSAAENGFFEGQRETGLQLLRHVARSSPENFARMVTENDK